ncbi:hypothetical protein TTHT_1329 [Thermotomaculum hydrothermale]|uniref:Uncharacterized protein n=1 Tax=Thermotomaculum hydrothermale TaxID=981385 RepID=A0A7R6PNI9_9BACT|nr:hypothetical protein [Thermotomaculum hydrothermale]BBB32843.1 hypothetical protein TTHT_1329 [Thermotomaculum hydrothermale]
MLRNKIILSVILILLFQVCGFAKIRNPFKRPSIIMLTLNSGQKPSSPKDRVKDLLNSLVLSGILNNSIAIINHQFYRVGDSLDLFKIKKILPNSVILTANGKDYELILNLSKELKENNRDKKTLNKEQYK